MDHMGRALCFWGVLCCCIGAVLGLSACGGEEPIRLGFSGCLTGKHSDLGKAGRDGVLLAVEEVNLQGGVNGRQLELIVKDDENDPARAVAVDRELIDAGASVLIGHMTSSMTMAAYDTVMESGILMLSPTTSTGQLTGLDDNFFRITPLTRDQSRHFAELLAEAYGFTSVAALLDLSNEAYTRDTLDSFAEDFTRLGGTVTATFTFDSNSENSFAGLAGKLVAADAEAIFILASALDTAMLCQQLMLQGNQALVLATGWAKTPALLHNGGLSVEGVLFSESVDTHGRQPAYLEFKAGYEQRFGREPTFAAVYGYEAVQVLARCLQQGEAAAAIKGCLLASGPFPGLQSPVAFDAYGDAHRPRIMVMVKNGDFVSVDRP